MKTQVVAIHGGDTFQKYEDYISYLTNRELSLDKIKRKDWKSYLQDSLGENFDVILPQMPNKQNAHYEEWKILFEKVLRLLDEEIILVGHSLGGIFLPKYLSENKVNKKILGTLLVAAPFNEDEAQYELGDFNLSSHSFDQFEKQGGKIIFYQSKDDAVVPFADMTKYQKLLPGVQFKIFEDRGHFNQTDFPEIVEDIKNLVQE
jgi:predicted alpha/beta hydrolase family esterase